MENWLKKIFFLLAILLSIVPEVVSAKAGQKNIDVIFSGKYGQVEIGSAYVGAEFHHSRPLPSRISFYYPVANSLDLSTDYWQRDNSKLFNITVQADDKVDTIGANPCTYSWTPFRADFTENRRFYTVEYSYRFCDDLPLMVLGIRFINRSSEIKKLDVSIRFSTVVRTCQTYAFKDTAEVLYKHNGAVYVANFRSLDTDSTSVFVVNAGALPNSGNKINEGKNRTYPKARFDYSRTIPSSGFLNIILLVGSSKIDEVPALIPKVLNLWRIKSREYEHKILRYIYSGARMIVPDSGVEFTSLWAKAMLITDRHYINGSIAPMPCPAEYNFFFTHDVLVTDLGATFFDLKRVKRDLLFIRSLASSDSLLPHAFYWKEDSFKTEYATPDNWNLLWFAILCGSYLKHSDDISTLKVLYPLLKKSVTMAISNISKNGVMCSTRPDWWDIGNNYGARSFLTALMVRALREYSYVAFRLRVDSSFSVKCTNDADQLQKRICKIFWNENARYLLDTIDTSRIDSHYYAGALVSVDYNLLDKDKAKKLVETARNSLVDHSLGVRTAMPADFDKLRDIYKFKDCEVGLPYTYLNGAVWIQTTAWYILALIELGEIDSAKMWFERFLTIEGIQNSPNGQPAFFEYRFSDPSSSLFGKIDKPNFMWAAGWYLNVLYHLIGLRENEWNISISPDIPEEFGNVRYDLAVDGGLTTVSFVGRGKYFKRIVIDGKVAATAVFTRKTASVCVERGKPTIPYLGNAKCVVHRVSYSYKRKELSLQVCGSWGQSSGVKVVSPERPRRVFIGKADFTSKALSQYDDGAYITELNFTFNNDNETVHFEY
jgi:hypothetical protein